MAKRPFTLVKPPNLMTDSSYIKSSSVKPVADKNISKIMTQVLREWARGSHYRANAGQWSILGCILVFWCSFNHLKIWPGLRHTYSIKCDGTCYPNGLMIMLQWRFWMGSQCCQNILSETALLLLLTSSTQRPVSKAIMWVSVKFHR